MWKNGKEGDTEGRRIMEGKDERRLKRKKKREPRKGGMRQAREGERRGERHERCRENRVGGNKIIAAWLRRCGIK